MKKTKKMKSEKGFAVVSKEDKDIMMWSVPLTGTRSLAVFQKKNEVPKAQSDGAYKVIPCTITYQID